jgi:hypothetical protein
VWRDGAEHATGDCAPRHCQRVPPRRGVVVLSRIPLRVPKSLLDARHADSQPVQGATRQPRFVRCLHEPLHADVTGRGGHLHAGDRVLDSTDRRRQHVGRINPTVRAGQEPHPGGGPGVGVRDVRASVERDAVPRDEPELEQGRGRSGKVPVEDADQGVAVEADVVRRNVVVSEQVRARRPLEPPGSRIREVARSLVEPSGPYSYGDQLSVAEDLLVDVDDSPRQEVQHLSSVPVDAVKARHRSHPLEVDKQTVDCR